MTIETKVKIAAIGLGLLVILAIVLLVIRRLPKRLKLEYFVASWRELQGLCRDKATWPLALIQADQLLDKALKRRRFKGKSMGERMVSAQHILTDNDAVWFAHNLVKKMTADSTKKPRQKDVKHALVGFRQALRDLGALPVDKV
jgi:hypothetical protein